MLTPFPVEFPAEAMQVVWDAWRGNAVEIRHASLCAWNVVGYLGGKALGPAPAMATDDANAVNLAFEAAIAQGCFPMNAAGASVDAVPWFLILQVAMEILSRFIRK